MIYSRSFHLKPNLIIGYTTRSHLLLDLDSTTEIQAEIIIRLIMQSYPKIGDCLLIESSTPQTIMHKRKQNNQSVLGEHKRNNYHLVFDNRIGYNLCCKIITHLAHIDILNKDYAKIRQFRGDLTLRVSPSVMSTYIKPIPKPIKLIPNNYTNKHDGMIKKYLWMLSIAKSLHEYMIKA